MENPFDIIMEKLNTIENLLSEIKHEKDNFTAGENKHEILNMTQASEFLSIAKSTLYKYTSERRIPHFKNGKRIYFKASELAEWLTQYKVMTMDEIEKEAANYIIRKGRK